MALKILFGSSFIMLGLLVSSPSHAEEVIAGSVYNESKEAEVTQKARRRAYPGGRDEGDLVVQSQLTSPTRKITPKVEPEHSDDD